MTVRATPTFLQAGSHSAEDTRLALAGFLGVPIATAFTPGSTARDPGHGIVNGTDLLVEQSDTPGMSVTVAAGAAFIRGGESQFQGVYHVVNDAEVTLTIDPSEANPRRDLIVFQVRDAGYSGASNDARLVVVKGTAAPSPSDPSLAAYPNALVLARITVTASPDSSIVTGDITDLRTALRRVERVTYTASDTFDKADYPGVKQIRVRVVGGGGAGGGAATTTAGQCSAGNGGGGGGYAESLLDVGDIASSVTVTVGAGGSGNAGASGGAGSASSFGSHVAANGAGGGNILTSSSSANTSAPNASGAAGTAGDIQISGETGAGTIRLGNGSGVSGKGGQAAGGFSIAGSMLGASGAGSDGRGYGAGGGGALNEELDANSRAGGDGADGVVIVDLYY